MVSYRNGLISAASESRLLKASPYLMLALAALVGWREGLEWLTGIRGRDGYGFSSYVYWINKASYANSGFIRRGLGPTIFGLFDHGAAQAGMTAFSLFCVLFLCIPLTVFIAKLARRGGFQPYWFSLILLLSPQLFRWWGADPGHSDMLSSASVAWALLATLDRRHGLAAVILLVGVLNHETALILGGPICAAFWFLDWRQREATLGQGFKGLGVLVVGLIVIVALQHAFGANPQQIARTIATGSTPDNSPWLHVGVVDPRLVAAYMTAGGFRSLVVSRCVIYAPPGAYLLALSCFLTLMLYVVIFPFTSRVGMMVFSVACLLPLTVLCIIAIDYGRWLVLAVMNGWLAAAALDIRGQESASQPIRTYALGGIALLVLLGLGAANPFASGMRILDLGKKIYGKPLDNPAAYLPACDPQWRRIALGSPAK